MKKQENSQLGSTYAMRTRNTLKMPKKEDELHNYPDDIEQVIKKRARQRSVKKEQSQKVVKGPTARQEVASKTQFRGMDKYLIRDSKVQQPRAVIQQKKECKSIEHQKLQLDTKVKLVQHNPQQRIKQAWIMAAFGKQFKFSNKLSKRQLQINEILFAADQEAFSLIERMHQVFKQDLVAIQLGKIPYHRLKLLSQYAPKLISVYFGAMFVQNGGLRVFVDWLLPFDDGTFKAGQLKQPPLALKMSILRILRDMQLTSEELKRFGLPLFEVLRRNLKYSTIPVLKDICKSLLKKWDVVFILKSIEADE